MPSLLDLLQNNNLTLRARLGIWELKLRRRERERQKATGLDKQNNDFARVSRIFVHFFAVTVRLGRECAFFWVLSGREHETKTFFLFLNFDTVLKNLIPEKFAKIWRVERDGINVIKFEGAQIHFLTDVFVAVVVVVAKKRSGFG